MLKKLVRYYYTIQYLRIRQIFYRLYYPVKRKFYIPPRYNNSYLDRTKALHFHKFYPPLSKQILEGSSFSFTLLNLTKTFNENIDWDFSGYGRLWTFHLNYFEWLHSSDLDFEAKLRTIQDFISKEAALQTALHPYTISLRGINWIIFLINNNHIDNNIHQSLWTQYHRLSAFVEYNIDGNHLWENACSLFFAAHYFNNAVFFNKSRLLLKEVLSKQILEDGGHFEQSPMYHNLVLYRLLQCINLYENSSLFKDETLYNTMLQSAKKMLAWINTFAFKDGSFALVNDSAADESPTLSYLNQYADFLKIKSNPDIRLGASGYRKWEGDNWEALIDAGNVTANYQPGHSHADFGNFCVQINNVPFIADTGISTYEDNEARRYQRSTRAHNTLHIENINTYDVWKNFRMGARTRSAIIEEKNNRLIINNLGYKKYGINHIREFIKEKNCLIIEEYINKNNKCCIFNIIILGDILEFNKEKQYVCTKVGRIEISGAKNVDIHYNIPVYTGFNKPILASFLQYEVNLTKCIIKISTC